MNPVLDIYDDPTASVLCRRLQETGCELPAKFASAALLEPADLEQLPDRLFALVALHDGAVLRKYAMHDESHLATSIVYFLEYGAQLEDAQQVKVAENLVNACAWYGETPPDHLVRLALRNKTSKGRVVGATGEVDWDDLDGYLKNEKNDQLMQAFQGTGVSPDPFRKVSNLTGTSMGVAGAMRNDPRPPTPERKGLMPKTSALEELRLVRQPRAKTASAQHHALRGMHPIDTVQQVKVAAAYLDESYTELSREDRFTFATGVYKRASELGVSLEGRAARFGDAQGYGDYIKDELYRRVEAFQGTDKVAGYEVLREHVEEIPAPVMVSMLQRLDAETKVAERYDAPAIGFRDPWHAVYEKRAAATPYSWCERGHYIGEESLLLLAKKGMDLDLALGTGFSTRFMRDPIAAFKSLAEDQKVVICRLANATADRNP